MRRHRLAARSQGSDNKQIFDPHWAAAVPFDRVLYGLPWLGIQADQWANRAEF